MDSLDIKFGKYTLVDKIGDGGMAEVYRARVAGVGGFEKIVALKKIHPSLSTNERFRKNFVNEARICGQLHHHNVVEVYEFDQVSDAFYLAMEYIDGLNLEELLNLQRKQDESLPNNVIVAIMAQALEGLSYAHSARSLDGKALNVIHRDLKPSNILIDHSGVVKIVDFGVAKADMDRYATQEMTAKGTASYMAPEQVLGEKKLTYAVDIFSAGAILYELITEKRLFDADHVFAILKKVATCNTDEVVANLPKHRMVFAPILRKLLAREPSDRVKSASEIVRDLKSLPVQGSTGPRALEQFLRDLDDDMDESQETIIDMGGIIDPTIPQEQEPEPGNLYETGPTKVAFMPIGHSTTTSIGPASLLKDEPDTDFEEEGPTQAGVPPGLFMTVPTRVQGAHLELDDDKGVQPRMEGSNRSVTRPSNNHHAAKGPQSPIQGFDLPDLGDEIDIQAARTVVGPYPHVMAQKQGTDPKKVEEDNPPAPEISPDAPSSLTLRALDVPQAENNSMGRWAAIIGGLTIVALVGAFFIFSKHNVTVDFASTLDQEATLGDEPSGVGVYVDGQFICYTPCSHQFSFRGDMAHLEAQGKKSGYKTQVLPLDIAAKSPAPQSFAFELQAIPQNIFITSVPEGAHITLDKNPTARFTPATLRVPKVGQYDIEVTLEGYAAIQKTIEVKEGATSFTYELEKAEK